MNEKYSKEEYEKKVSEYNLKSRKTHELLLKKFLELKKTLSTNKTIINSEGCTGSSILGSKNCHQCYDIQNIQDGRYLFNLMNSNDTGDCYSGKKQELNYECTSCSRSYNTKFGVRVTDSADCDYCLYSRNSKNLFACIGLKQNSYCIFNKQYSKEDYFALREKIIEHMKKDESWGEFFPMAFSPFAYNEAIVNEYFPLTKEEAVAQGYTWRDEEKKDYKSATAQIPDTIENLSDGICDETLACTTCGKNYQIQKQELKIHRRINIPLSPKCADCRHLKRMELRNPRKLWERNCDNCKIEIQTSFDPKRSEKVYCESCYLKCIH
jgi:hypothetical protein